MGYIMEPGKLRSRLCSTGGQEDTALTRLIRCTEESSEKLSSDCPLQVGLTRADADAVTDWAP